MSARPLRLGDALDDYCSRCRLLLNHAVVGMVGEEVKKVRCLTCRNEHSYRHATPGRKTKGGVAALFDEVLRGMPRPAGSPATPPSRSPPGKPQDEPAAQGPRPGAEDEER